MRFASLTIVLVVASVLSLLSTPADAHVGWGSPQQVVALSPVAPVAPVQGVVAVRPVYRPLFGNWFARRAARFGYAPATAVVAARPVTAFRPVVATGVTAFRPVMVAAPTAVTAASPCCPTACQPATTCCARPVVSYMPQTCYRNVTVNVPVTVNQAVTTCDPCTGCPVTCMRPVTTMVQQCRRVPYTSYRPVVSYKMQCTQTCAAPTTCCPTNCCPTSSCATAAPVAPAAPAAGGACCASGLADAAPAAPAVDTTPRPSLAPPVDSTLHRPQTSLPASQSGRTFTPMQQQADPPAPPVQPMRELDNRYTPTLPLEVDKPVEKTAGLKTSRDFKRVSLKVPVTKSKPKLDDGGWRAASR